MKRPGRKFNPGIQFLCIILFGSFAFLMGCLGSGGNQTISNKSKTDTLLNKLSRNFNADSAYSFTQKQVDFGPRIPGTEAHEKCARYLLGKLKEYGLSSYFQEGSAQVYTGKTFPLKNIIGSYNPTNPVRILLTAHWDTRPFSDQETDSALATKTFDGANDASSAVGILLELARQIHLNNPKLGVDIIFWDIEDYGAKHDESEGEKTWCLGTQYWVAHPPVKGYNPMYCINLDMVGGQGAVFNEEKASMQNDPKLVKQIWDLGNELGYSQFFAYHELEGAIIDDHVVVNKGANIPSIDIIDLTDKTNTGFYKYWHTQGDTMSHLDKEVMKAVGQTLLENIYREAKSNSSS